MVDELDGSKKEAKKKVKKSKMSTQVDEEMKQKSWVFEDWRFYHASRVQKKASESRRKVLRKNLFDILFAFTSVKDSFMGMKAVWANFV